MIDINQLSVHYQNNRALDIREAIHIGAGERIGIIGSNGAGKTTLIKAILGSVPSRGSIRLGIPQHRIAVHMQQNEYSSAVRVRCVMEAILGCTLEQHPAAWELIRFFDFETSLKKRFSQLSGGQKQRLTLILVMCADSPLTIFDEVTSGLDFETRQRLVAKLSDWYRGRTNTLLLVSHYYEELEQLADKLLYLEHGRLVAFGEKHDLFQKYCGRAVLIADRTKQAERMAGDWPRLAAPGHLLALRCDSEADEARLTERFRQANLNYKRSNNDIEIMTLSAKAAWQHQMGENGEAQYHVS